MIVLGAMVVAAVVTAAFGDEGSTPAVVVEWVPNGPGFSQTPAATNTPDPDTEPRPTVGDVAGLVFPIEGGCLPDDDNLMPGALREYRDGTHEGMDIYDSDSCAFVGLDTEVLAAKAGTVIRADHDYADLDAQTLAGLEALVEEGRAFETEDAFRGRQVWVQHADVSVTRYAHLADIVEDLEPGDAVALGEVIAYVGESGTPESVTDPGTQVHLHFEIRIGDSYLGAGLDPDTVRSLYAAAFAP